MESSVFIVSDYRRVCFFVKLVEVCLKLLKYRSIDVNVKRIVVRLSVLEEMFFFGLIWLSILLISFLLLKFFNYIVLA